MPEVERLGDRRLGVVGDVGRALERDEAVVAAAAFVGRPQDRGGTADVVERDREEQLPPVVPPAETSGAAARRSGPIR